MPTLQEKLVAIANELIDQMIERDGLRWTIEWLLCEGHLTGQELLEMEFDIMDIRAVLEENPSLDPTWVHVDEEEM